jgi:hypothetical protein
MLNDILNAANKYADGLKSVLDRREHWLVKHKELKDHLKKTADYLNVNTTYRQGFFIDTLHAFNEDMKGTCAEMPSITFRSGEMPMQVTFRNNIGERKEYIEQGFHITFNPTITGQIVVLLLPHYSDLNEKPLPYTTLAIIDDPGQLTMDFADEMIRKGLEAAFFSSFTGISEQGEEEQPEPNPSHEHNPIGFKRYETTEKVK